MEKNERIANDNDDDNTERLEQLEIDDVFGITQPSTRMRQNEALNSDIHAWRKVHSVTNQRNPKLYRQLSQGKTMSIVA